MLITIRSKTLLKLFGWGWYNKEKRLNFPGSVTASPGLWFRWFKEHLGRFLVER